VIFLLKIYLGIADLRLFCHRNDKRTYETSKGYEMNRHASSINDEKKDSEVAANLACAFEAMAKGDLSRVVDIAKGVLRIDEETPQAHYLIARVTIETGQLDLALKYLETAVKLDASTSDYWAFLALVYSLTGKMDKAESAVMKAQKIGSNKADVLRPIAHVFTVLGHFKDAAKNLRKAVQKSPDNPIYHHSLGVCLLEIGDFKGAKLSFEQAVALNSNDVKSRWMLSSLDKAENNETADEIISIMKKTEAFPQQHAYLGYAAGKLFEDTKCWDKAFAAFERGATGKRCIVNYERAQAKKTFEALKSVCTSHWLQASVNEFKEDNGPVPIFIVGQPRTGSTIVDRIISNHSLVQSAGEPLQMAMSLREITGVRTKEFISAELIQKSTNIIGQELAESYLSGLANMRGKTSYFIDKLPMNFMLIGFIVKAFPKAKIIHVTRSPADTCFAVFKQLFGDIYQHSYDQSEMADHYVMYHDLMKHWHEVMPGKIFDVPYEDIVLDNNNQARKLIQHLGLEWEVLCGRFEENNTAVITASAAQVREKAHSRSVGRWKHYQKQLSPTLDILEAAGISP
jgi:Tfp pilus assembly protein PilF